MHPKKQQIARSRAPQKRIFRDIEEYERLMQQPPDTGNSDDHIEAAEGEFDQGRDAHDEFRPNA